MTAVLVGPIGLWYVVKLPSHFQVLYVFLGAISGYLSARLYKSKFFQAWLVSHCVVCISVMGGLKWKSNVLMTALFVPGYALLLMLLDICMM